MQKIIQKKTYYHIILDQSGSMQDCLEPTISGFNEQLQVIKSLQERYPEQEIKVGLTRFNDEVMHTYSAQLPSRVAELSQAIYKPGGCTALYDAIGLSTKMIRQVIEMDLNAYISTIVVIITDGYENASTHFDLLQIKSLVKELESTGKWTFSYLGATLDAVKIATSLNIKQQNSMCFEKHVMKDTFEMLGSSMDNYLKERKEGKNPTEFLQRKNQSR